MMGFNWDSRAVAAAPIPLDKLPLIENAVTNQCDASDGLLDGLVQDPRACSFEPAVLRCQGAETKDCLSGAQIEAVREVYGGPANSSGRRITPGFPSGAESNGGWDVRCFLRLGRLGRAGQGAPAHHRLGGLGGGRTRPLCPYPQQAVYKGKGNIDDAANFVCAAPKQADDD